MNVSDRPAALILAGSRHTGDPVAVAGGVRRKAFVQIAGRTMLEHVVDALIMSDRVGEILISCEADIDLVREVPGLAPLLAKGRVRPVPSAEGPSASALRVYESLEGVEGLFLTTADHPLLTGEIVREFLDRFAASGADVGVGLAPLDLVMAAYPRNRRTALRFRDGAFSGCNLFVFRGGQRGKAAIALWRRIEADRKRPLRMAIRLGPAILLLHVLGLLSLRGAFDRIARRLQITATPIVIANPDAATDVDSLEDLALVREILDRGSAPPDQMR